MTTDTETGIGEGSYRPALAKLAMDLDESRETLLEGFMDEAEFVEWLQSVTVRTLGELPMPFLRGAADQVRKAAMPGVTPAVYRHLVGEVSSEVDRETRLYLWREYLEPAYYRAFKRLRKSVTEYVDTEEPGAEGTHHPARQRYVAMRPAINELDQYQKRCLARIQAAYSCLDVEPLEEPSDILQWGSELRLATHGELAPDFVARCQGEPGTRRILLTGRRTTLFAAVYLLPAYNAGIRDLSGRTGEVPAGESQDRASTASLGGG